MASAKPGRSERDGREYPLMAGTGSPLWSPQADFGR